MVSQLLKGTIIRKYLFRSVIGLVSQHALSNMVTQLWALFDDNGNWLFGEPSYSICSSLTWASLSILAWWGKAAPRLAITNWITRTKGLPALLSFAKKPNLPTGSKLNHYFILLSLTVTPWMWMYSSFKNMGSPALFNISHTYFCPGCQDKEVNILTVIYTKRLI